MQVGGIRYYEFGEFQLDVRRRVLLKNGRPLRLTARNFDLLLFMVENGGRVLSHDEILDKVWEGLFVEQSNLKKGISALRQIFAESPNEGAFIKTVPRQGYSFVAPVRAVPEGEPAVLYRETDAEILVEEIIEDEDEAVEVEPHDAPALPPRRQTLWQHQKYLLIASALIIGLAAGGVWLLLRRGKNSANVPRLENLRMRKLTSGGNIQTAALSPDGKTLVYATVDESNRQTLWARSVGLSNALQLVPPASDAIYQAIVFAPDGNSVYYGVTVSGSQDFLYRIPILGGAARKIVENISSAVTFSPDGKRLAFARDVPGAGRVLVTAESADGSDERQIYTVADNHKLIEPRWSPDGTKLAFISSETINGGRIWTVAEVSVTGGEAVHVLLPQRGKIYYFDWTRDGKGLILSADPEDSMQTQLWYAAYPGGEKARLTNDIAVYREVSLSADGRTFLAVQRERLGDLWSLDWENPANVSRVTETQYYNGSFAIAPDGRILAESVESGKRELSFVGADGSNPLPLFSQSSSELNPSITPDGRTILYTSRRTGEEEIWQADLDGRNARPLTDEKTFVSFPRLSPDGKYIFFGRYNGEGWRLVKMPAQGGNLETLDDKMFWAYDFSPDGTQLAYSFFDEQKKRWQVGIRDVATNALQKQLDISPMTFVRWTRDGQGLIYNAPGIFRDGGNLWVQPVAGGTPRLLFDAKDDKVFWADWSPDGRKLYLTRGKSVSNIVLLAQERAAN